MGGEESRSAQPEIPELYYIYRQKSTVLHILNGQVIKLKFSKKLKIRKDAAIGYLPAHKLLVCGGTDSTGCFTTKCYIIDPVSQSIKLASPLPAPSRSGYLFEFRNWVYYIGGLSECDLDDDDESERPSKLMRYNLIENYWQVIDNNKEPQPLDETQRAKLTLTDLYLPSIFLHSNRLYFLGGKVKNSKGKLHPSSKIFSMALDSEEFQLRPEKFNLPAKVKNPVCVSRGADVIVTGGHIGEEFNRSCWSLSLGKGKAEFFQEPEFGLSSVDSFPPLYYERVVVLFAFPEIAMLRQKGGWEKITIVQKKNKPPTEALNKKMVFDPRPRNNSPVTTKTGKKKQKKVQRIEESESEEEKINPFPTLEGFKQQKSQPFVDSDDE